MRVPRLVLVLALLVGARPAAAQTTYTSAATGNWSNSASWSPTGVPVAGDTATVAAGHTITVDGAQAVASLTVSASGVLIANTLTIGGNLTNRGTFTHNSGTVTFNAASGTQTIGGTSSTTFYNLILSNAATRQFGNDTAARTFTVSNTLTWSGGSISVGQATVADRIYLSSTTLNSPLTVPAGRSLTTVGTSAFHLRGSAATNGIRLSSSATLSLADATASVTCGGNFDINSGSTYTGTAGTTTFNGTTTISGSSTNINFGVLTITSSGAVSTSSTGTTRIVRVAGNFSNAGSYTHTLVTDRTTDGSTLVFDGTTTLSGAGTFTFISVKINPNMALTSSSGNINVSGDWTNNGTFTHNLGTVTLNGTGSQTLGGATTFYDLTENNTVVDDFNNPVTISANVTVTRAHPLTARRLKIANGKTLTVGADGVGNGHSVAAGATLDVQHSVAGTATLKVEKGDILTVSGLIEVTWESGGITVAFDVALPGTGTEATIRIASGAETTLLDFQAIGAGKFEIMTGGKLVEFSESTSCAWSLDLDNTTSADRARIPYSLSGVTFNGTTSVIAGWSTPSVWMFGGSGASNETDPGGKVHWLSGAFGKVDGTISSSGTAVTGSGTNFLTADDAGRSIRVGAETRTISSVQSGTGLTLSSAFSSSLSAGAKYAILYDTLPLAVNLNSGASTTIRMSPAVPMNYNFDINDWSGTGSYTLENFVFAPVQPNGFERKALVDGDTGTAARCTLRNCIVARGGLDEIAADNCTIYPLSGAAAITFTNRGTVRNTIELGATTPVDANKNILVSDTDAATYFLDRATLDFHLKSGAANAIDTGQSLTLASDLEGQTRPNGSAWDVGADEYYTVNGGAISKISIGTGPVTRLFYLGKRSSSGPNTAYGVSGNTLAVINVDSLAVITSTTLEGQIVYLTYWQDDVTSVERVAWIFCVIDTGSPAYGYGDAIQCVVDRGTTNGLHHPIEPLSNADAYRRRFGSVDILGNGTRYAYRPGAAGEYKIKYLSIMNVYPDGTADANGDGNAGNDPEFNNPSSRNLTRWLRGFYTAYKTTATTGGALFKLNADPYDQDSVQTPDNQAFGEEMWSLIPAATPPADWRNFEWDASCTFTWGETSTRLFVPCSNTTGTTQQVAVRFNRNTLTSSGAVDTYWQALEEAASSDECIGITTDNGGDNSNLTYALRDGLVVYNRKRGAANNYGAIRHCAKLPSNPVTLAQRIWGTHYALVGVDGGVHKIFDDIASDTNPKSGCLAMTGEKVTPDDNAGNGIQTDSSQSTSTKDLDWPLACIGKPVGKIWVRQTKIYWVTDQGYLYGYNWNRWGDSLATGDETAISGFPIHLGAPARSIYVFTNTMVVGLDTGDVYQVNP